MLIMRILLIGSTRSMHTEALKLAGSASCFVRRSTVQSFDLEPAYDRLVVFEDQATPEDWIQVARSLHESQPYQAVCAYHDEEMPLAATIARALGVYTTIRPAVVDATLDKETTRRMVREAGLDPTEARRVGSRADILEFAREHGYPIILKPRAGTGSAGVSRISGEEEINAALRRLDEVGEGFPAVVETYIEGDVFGVDAVSEEGAHRLLAVTGVIKDQNARFVGQGHILPAPLPPERRDEVARFIGGVLDAIGVSDGPSHTEVILGSNGPRLVETHVRMGGDHLPKLMKLAFEIDVPHLVARQSLGEKIFHLFPESLPTRRFAAIWYQSPTQAGVLTKIEGIEEASSLEGVHLIQVGCRLGDQVQQVKKATDRPACAIASGPSPEEALERARRAADTVRLHIEPV